MAAGGAEGAAVWADVLSATERAARLGAVYSIDTGTQLLKDERSGVEVRAGAQPHLRVAARCWVARALLLSARLPRTRENCAQFVVRVAKALRDKPKAAPPAADGAPKPPSVNPFLPYDEALFVRNVVRNNTWGRLRGRDLCRCAPPPRPLLVSPDRFRANRDATGQAPHHALLQNKFNVVPHHLLLITRAFEHQTEPLSAADFEALRAALRAFPPPGGLAFMNVGEASGFSQPHKHIQLVPLPFAQELAHAPVPIGPLVERAAAEARQRAGASAEQPLRFEVRALPFRNACVTLNDDATPEQLARTYDELLTSLGLSAPAASFNLLMTASWLMVIPRSAEHGNGVAVNALGFAGTMLVRSPTRNTYIFGAC
jgi:ATP adenylyltransferase